MSEQFADFEGLLRRALAPVEPPEELVERLESTLADADRAGGRRARGLGARRDARPAQLGAPRRRRGVGTAAGAGWSSCGVRNQHKRQKRHVACALELAERTLRSAADEARRLLERVIRSAPRGA